MKILVANRHLQSIGGSETFTYTLIMELKRMGYELEYFTLYKGIVSKKIEESGVQFSTQVNYDLILAGQVDTITELRRLKFTGPLIQICHGVLTKGEQPHPDADGYIAISEEVQKHLGALNYMAPVILNGIDTTRYRPTRKLRKIPKVIASLVQTDEAHQLIADAASQLGMEVIRLNKYQDKIWEIEKEINKADIVVSLGRGCYEAMACGRPVVIFDKRRYQASLADGYLSPGKFDDLVRTNCSGRAEKLTFSVDDLVSEIKKYNPEDGPSLRMIALDKLNIHKQANEILKYAMSYQKYYQYPGTIDLVYVLGKGSHWGDNEIRYSIRSFKKHFRDLRNVVIVGECPDWLRGVIHIPFPDNMHINKDARMLQKVAAACRDSRVSENFIFNTDDTYLNRDLSFEDFTGWHEGPMMYDADKDYQDHRGGQNVKGSIKPSHWLDYVYATGLELKKRGLTDFNYDRAHCPQPVNKNEFLKVLEQWDIINNHYTCSNLYQNSSKMWPGSDIRTRNGKVYLPMKKEELTAYLADKIAFNVNDNGLTDQVKEFLHVIFPDPSEYETFTTEPNKRKAVENWFRNGCNYDEGLAIVIRFAPKNVPLRKYLENKKGSETAKIKLRKTLRLWMY